jgi:hypothetical protein
LYACACRVLVYSLSSKGRGTEHPCFHGSHPSPQANRGHLFLSQLLIVSSKERRIKIIIFRQIRVRGDGVKDYDINHMVPELAQ